MPKQPAQKELIKIFIVPFAVILLLLLATFNLQSYLDPNNETEVLSYQTSLDEESAFWKEFLSENPSYVPGWVEYAKINYQLENYEEANIAIEEVKRLDPNYDLSIEEYLN